MEKQVLTQAGFLCRGKKLRHFSSNEVSLLRKYNSSSSRECGRFMERMLRYEVIVLEIGNVSLLGATEQTFPDIVYSFEICVHGLK